MNTGTHRAVLFLSFIMLVAQATSANAATAMKGYFDGNRLYDDCKDESNELSQGFCIGYVSGLVDLDLAYSSMSESYRQQYCLRGSVNPMHLKDTVIQYLEANPEQRRYPAAGNVVAALANAFPCPKEKDSEASKLSS